MSAVMMSILDGASELVISLTTAVRPERDMTSPRKRPLQFYREQRRTDSYTRLQISMEKTRFLVSVTVT